MNQWFARNGIRPRVVAEFEDSALLKVFGADGAGHLRGAPRSSSGRWPRSTASGCWGGSTRSRERFYAISVERRLKHPAVVAISDAARQALFAPH